MRIVICDDEKETVDRLKSIITGYFADKGLPVPAIDVFDSGESLLLDSKKKDIVFLDIEMPGLDGISTGRKLLEEDRNTIIIIVTSFDRYLDEAMRINVFRYISKPLDPERIKRNLGDAIGSYNTRLDKTIVIETKSGTICYNSSDIIMLEMIGRKVTLYTENGSETTDKTLKEWMSILPEDLFIHCHRSYIVNISHIKQITRDKILMDNNGLAAYLTLRKHADIKKKWMLYIESRV